MHTALSLEHAGNALEDFLPADLHLHQRIGLLLLGDRAYFGGRGGDEQDQIGYIDANTRAIFGRSYAAEPATLVKQLAADEAIAAADTLLLTVPNQLGVEYNAHALESILKYVAPELGWR